MQTSKSTLLLGVLAMLTACDPPQDSPPVEQPEDALRAEDIGPSVTATIGAAGGVVESTHDGVTIRLEVPASALADDTELTLTPARLIGVDGVVAARFAPDGLTFAVPALLQISPAPAGDVLVALQDGGIPVEAELAVRLPDAAVSAVTHFSTHGVADASAALQALPADVRAQVESLRGQSAAAVAAIGIGIFYRTHVEPLLPLSARDVHGFEIAATAATAWLSVVDARVDTHALPYDQGGSETVKELRTRVDEDLLAAGRELLARVSQPACTGTPDIASVLDWGRLQSKLVSLLELMGDPERVAPESCLRPRLQVDGPTSLTANTRELQLVVVAPRAPRPEFDAILRRGRPTNAKGLGRAAPFWG